VTKPKVAKAVPEVPFEASEQLGEATRFTTLDRPPSEEENLAAMRKQFEQIMARRPVALVMHAELPDGGEVTGAAGPPAGLEALCRVGFAQLLDMLARAGHSGENG
jgi:hypothetical protein